MFCGECGTKNEKGSIYCENCGHKLENAEPLKKKVKENPKKPMDKKQKTILSVVVVIVVLFVGLFMYMGNLCKPENVALKYFKAVASKDVDDLYSVLYLEKSDFVNKKILKDKLKDEKEIELANYKVKKGDVDKDDLSTSVKITYVEEGSSREKYQTVKLVKSKKKKWLFFDNWTVDSSSLVVKDYKLYVPSKATIKLDGIKVDKKYKNEKLSTSSTDVYEIPTILSFKYKADIKLENGIELEDDISVRSSYDYYRTTNTHLAKKTETKLKKDILSKMKTIYNAAIDDKSFDDIKDSFEVDDKDDIKDAYENLKSGLSLYSYRKLTKIDFKKADITNVSVDEDEIELSVKLSYEYSLKYKLFDKEEEYNSKEQSDICYLTYKYEDDKFVLIDMSGLNYYYSTY